MGSRGCLCIQTHRGHCLHCGMTEQRPKLHQASKRYRSPWWEEPKSGEEGAIRTRCSGNSAATCHQETGLHVGRKLRLTRKAFQEVFVQSTRRGADAFISSLAPWTSCTHLLSTCYVWAAVPYNREACTMCVSVPISPAEDRSHPARRRPRKCEKAERVDVAYTGAASLPPEPT